MRSGESTKSETIGRINKPRLSRAIVKRRSREWYLKAKQHYLLLRHKRASHPPAINLKDTSRQGFNTVKEMRADADLPIISTNSTINATWHFEMEIMEQRVKWHTNNCLGKFFFLRWSFSLVYFNDDDSPLWNYRVQQFKEKTTHKKKQQLSFFHDSRTVTISTRIFHLKSFYEVFFCVKSWISWKRKLR